MQKWPLVATQSRSIIRKYVHCYIIVAFSSCAVLTTEKEGFETGTQWTQFARRQKARKNLKPPNDTLPKALSSAVRSQIAVFRSRNETQRLFNCAAKRGPGEKTEEREQ